MKAPRLADFDPSTKAGQLHSPLDDMPAIETSAHRPSPARREVTPPFDAAEQGPVAFPSTPSTEPLPAVNPDAATPIPEPFPLDGPSGRSPVDPDVRSPVRPPVRVHKRTITRYSFEFYRDQIESLRDLSLEEKQRGETGSMSAMVREAVDAYLATRHRTED